MPATKAARSGAASDAVCPSRERRYEASPRTPEATTLVVASNRGLYRSENGGETWMLKEDNLPTHPRLDRSHATQPMPACATAAASPTPYSEVWRAASEGGNLLGAARSHQPCRRHLILAAAPNRRLVVCLSPGTLALGGNG